MEEMLNSKYIISDGMGKMDFGRVTKMLGEAYWSKGIGRGEVLKGAENSALVVGVFTAEGMQIGYSRVISDKTRFAYILDVYVDEDYRRIGIGRGMIGFILNHPEFRDVYQWLLITSDAHGVYAKAGFQPLQTPERWMEIRHQRP